MSVVNLNKARKAKARADKTVWANANSAKFGRPKSEKSQQKALFDLASKQLDGHKTKVVSKSE